MYANGMQFMQKKGQRQKAGRADGVFHDLPSCSSYEDKDVAAFVKFSIVMVLLDTDPFLNELTKLYENNRESGTVWVTLKRSTLERPRKRKSEEDAADAGDAQYRCLVRATDGKKKISAALTAKDHQRFQMAYATVLKAHMDSLKKRDKKDKKEKKGTQGTKSTGS
ncbi:hypothetical protein R1sor_002217 [Riccia sorocarpa]|uniref:Signal recognition particle 14 kDa protein n=1 Tax=Riccia sorocarpa TaxID=122646 RepID=A0ABD3GY65_9MARC